MLYTQPRHEGYFAKWIMAKLGPLQNTPAKIITGILFKSKLWLIGQITC